MILINSRRKRNPRYVTHMGDKCIQKFVRKILGIRTLGRPRRRWEDNIEDIRVIMCKGSNHSHFTLMKELLNRSESPIPG
jgi:hypothetical protein